MPVPFLIDVYGPFAQGQVVVQWRDEPRRPDPALDERVARIWDHEVERRRGSGVILYNGRLARHLRHGVMDGAFTLEVGPTDYANFLATNLLNAPHGDDWGWDLFSNPIGTSCTPVTSDGWLLLGRRNHQVAYHPGYCHAIGGGLEMCDRRADGTLDAFASILRELNEELHVRPEEVREVVCLGLIRDAEMRQPELVFDAELALTRADLEARFQLGEAGQEHAALLACRNEPEAIGPFIQASMPITPVAVGALCLHGRRRFGQAWYDRVLNDAVFLEWINGAKSLP